MEITDLLNTITQTLENLEVPYMLTGSLALNLYALPRSTHVIDIVVELQEKHIPHFKESIKNDFYFNELTIKNEIKKSGMFNIIHLSSGYKVDFIIRKENTYEIQKFERRKMLNYLNTKIYVISLEDLIISKLMWIQKLESELQKRDIQNLLENPKTDLNYIKNWCSKLKLNTFQLIKYE
jgi:hypothetical protein